MDGVEVNLLACCQLMGSGHMKESLAVTLWVTSVSRDTSDATENLCIISLDCNGSHKYSYRQPNLLNSPERRLHRLVPGSGSNFWRPVRSSAFNFQSLPSTTGWGLPRIICLSANVSVRKRCKVCKNVGEQTDNLQRQNHHVITQPNKRERPQMNAPNRKRNQQK